MSGKVFDFGENWKNFSSESLSSLKIEQARADFSVLMDGVEIKDRSFLDIGFGQGLSLLIATESGARTLGNDINPLCHEALEVSRKHFPEVEHAVPVVVGSILEPSVQEELLQKGEDGVFDIVHSWGVLHHTGSMWEAISIAAKMVKPGGHLVLALYNAHWTAPWWLAIKRWYCNSPAVLRHMMVWLYVVASIVKMVLSGSNPFRRGRGMGLYYDAVDWVGGYPYEYASREEVEAFLVPLGFRLQKFVPTAGFTGCNEFLLVRDSL